VTTPQQHVVIAVAALGLLDEITDLKRQIRLSRDVEQCSDLESAIAKSAAQLHAFLPTDQPVPDVLRDMPVEPLVTPIVEPCRPYRPRRERCGARPLRIDGAHPRRESSAETR
jgi:hypothetical protein